MDANNINNDKNKDYKYEYNKTLLTNLESKYIYIPLSVIVDNNIDTKRVSVFSYLRIHCGLNDLIGFTIPDLVAWCGMKPNSREGKINDKFLNIVDNFSDRDYLTFSTQKDVENSLLPMEKPQVLLWKTPFFSKKAGCF